MLSCFSFLEWLCVDETVLTQISVYQIQLALSTGILIARPEWAHHDTALVFSLSSLSSPEGGEGWGEEVVSFPAEIPSPRPSPRLGGARE